jgi:hypothetical protein
MEVVVCLFDGVLRHFQQYFSYIVAVSFIGRVTWRTRKKPPTCRNSDKLYHIMLYTSPWSGLSSTKQTLLSFHQKVTYSLHYIGAVVAIDCMVVGFTITYAISPYHHWCCEFESWSGRGVQHYVIKFVWIATGWWFFPGSPGYSTNKTDRHGKELFSLKGTTFVICSKLWLVN